MHSSQFCSDILYPSLYWNVWWTRRDFLPPASAVEVIELEPFVCVCLSVCPNSHDWSIFTHTYCCIHHVHGRHSLNVTFFRWRLYIFFHMKSDTSGPSYKYIWNNSWFFVDFHRWSFHDKQTSSQRKCREHLSNQPSHRDNATHQGISISQPCYEDEWMEWYTK